MDQFDGSNIDDLINEAVGDSGGGFGSRIVDAVGGAFGNNNGRVDIGDFTSLLPILGGIAGYSGAFSPDQPSIGYQGEVPKLDATRQTIDNFSNREDGRVRVPGSYGQRYFSDTSFTNKDDQAALSSAQHLTGLQADSLRQGNVNRADEMSDLLDYLNTSPQGTPGADTGGNTVGNADDIGMLIELLTRGQLMNNQNNQQGGGTPYSPDPADPTTDPITETGGPTPYSPGQQPTGNERRLVQGSGQMPVVDTYDTVLTKEPAVGNRGIWIHTADGDLVKKSNQDVGDHYRVDMGEGNFNFYETLEDAQAAASNITGKDYQGFEPNNFYARTGQDVRKYAEGGYLRGPSDGMADEVSAVIDNEQPAALSEGEFVIPADVVSHLGNGNSEAGAAHLDQFMANVRRARTGTDEQAPQIDVNSIMERMNGMFGK